MAKPPTKKKAAVKRAKTKEYVDQPLPEGEEIMTPGTPPPVKPEDAAYAQSAAETVARAKAEAAAEATAVPAPSTRELRPPTAPVE